MDLRPNEQRAKIAILLVGSVLILDIISLLFDYLEYVLINSPFIDIEDAESNDLRQMILAVIYFTVYVASAVTFIMWFRRAYFNLHEKVNNLEHGEGWAAGSWFVPFINLFRPYHIMKELYSETENLLSRANENYKKSLSTNLVGAWWGFWILSNFLARAVFSKNLKAETIEELSESACLSMVNTAISIPLALITIKLIYDYSKAETVLFNLKEVKNEEEI